MGEMSGNVNDCEREREAALLMARAEEWTRENPDAWAYMVRLAEREAAAERRFSMQWLIEQIRKVDFADVRGRKSGVNHNIAAALARILERERPGVSRWLTRRRASVDSLER